MDALRIIKKYPNRRLYDTVISRYITLDEVKQLVLEQISFKIIDDRSDEDMTNYVLLQILMQEESNHSPILTADILKSLICFYGNPLQQAVSNFLEKGLSLFSEKESAQPE
jgi:polyhydroxyalkanoate synthesis repressor PhaR